MLLSPAFRGVAQTSHYWWQPMTRWVEILHLPIRLHHPRILSPLVAHFGSFVSSSYSANIKNRKVILVLVRNCFITKIPHILPVREGDRIFPVRVQVVFEEKISGEGINYDPADLGDKFCSINSNGHYPINPVFQARPAEPQASAFLSSASGTNTKDKETSTRTCSTVTDVDWSSSAIQGSVPIRQIPSLDQLFVPSQASNTLSGLNHIGHLKNPSAISDLEIVKTISASNLDNNLSSKKKSNFGDSAVRTLETVPNTSLSKDSILLGFDKEQKILQVPESRQRKKVLFPYANPTIVYKRRKSLKVNGFDANGEDTTLTIYNQQASLVNVSAVKVIQPLTTAPSHSDIKEQSPALITRGVISEEQSSQSFGKVHSNFGTHHLLK